MYEYYPEKSHIVDVKCGNKSSPNMYLVTTTKIYYTTHQCKIANKDGCHQNHYCMNTEINRRCTKMGPFYFQTL